MNSHPSTPLLPTNYPMRRKTWVLLPTKTSLMIPIQWLMWRSTNRLRKLKLRVRSQLKQGQLPRSITIWPNNWSLPWNRSWANTSKKWAQLSPKGPSSRTSGSSSPRRSTRPSWPSSSSSIWKSMPSSSTRKDLLKLLLISTLRSSKRRWWSSKKNWWWEWRKAQSGPTWLTAKLLRKTCYWLISNTSSMISSN